MRSVWDERAFQERLKAKRQQMSAMHDDGAAEALKEVMWDNVEVQCGTYCYGGTSKHDFEGILADLAEAGWRLQKVST